MKMKQKELSDFTDQELLQEAKKIKSNHITNAVFIGFLIGISLYSICKNSLGFFALIPLFFVYKLTNKSKYNSAELNRLLKERNLN